MTRAYILDPTFARAATMGLAPGVHYYKARLVKDGPYVGIKTEAPEVADPGIDAKDQHRVWIGGEEIPFERWHPMTLIGEEVTAQEYEYALKALAWDKAHAGVSEREAVDIMALPAASLMPPVHNTPLVTIPLSAGDIEVSE